MTGKSDYGYPQSVELKIVRNLGFGLRSLYGHVFFLGVGNRYRTHRQYQRGPRLGAMFTGSGNTYAVRS